VFRAHAARAPAKDSLSMVQYIDMKTYLPGDILVKVDRASMAHSLEVRVPILDYTFIDWVSGLPPALKLHNGEGKYIFKKSMESILPHDLMYRRKMGFAVPLPEWFRGPLKERLRDSLLGPSLQSTGMFERERVRQLVDEHTSGARDHSAALWALLMFDGSMRALRP
jgi:asparagine synthase (glutamine-hydrolysing)